VKPFGWARKWSLTELQRITASQSPSLEPAEVPREICASTAEENRDVYAAIASEIQKSAARQLIHYELVARARVAGSARRNDSSRQCRSGSGTTDRDNAIALEADGAAAEGPFQRCGLERIPDYRVNGTDSEQIHRSAARHAEGAGIPAPAVLDREVWR